MTAISAPAPGSALALTTGLLTAASAAAPPLETDFAALLGLAGTPAPVAGDEPAATGLLASGNSGKSAGKNLPDLPSLDEAEPDDTATKGGATALSTAFVPPELADLLGLQAAGAATPPSTPAPVTCSAPVVPMRTTVPTVVPTRMEAGTPQRLPRRDTAEATNVSGTPQPLQPAAAAALPSIAAALSKPEALTSLRLAPIVTEDASAPAPQPSSEPLVAARLAAPAPVTPLGASERDAAAAIQPVIALQPRRPAKSTQEQATAAPAEAKDRLRAPSEIAAAPLFTSSPASAGLPMPQPAVAADPQTASAPGSTVSPEAPRDFAMLVSRLNEAREAASPQVVRTALSHQEFGPVGLQFRHEGEGLSVTMASGDPAFAASVQAAAIASLNGSAAGQNDTARDGTAPQQHRSQSNSQTQTGQAQTDLSSGQNAGAGSGRHDAPARAFEPARPKTSSARDPRADTHAPRPDRGGTRPGDGIYA